MPREIDGVRYVAIKELLSSLGISRQTFWRWRQQGSVPPGRRFRTKELLFTVEEVLEIREFSNRLEPANTGVTMRQLRLPLSMTE